MIRSLAPNEKITTTKIGGFCPYWTRVGKQIYVADTAEEIIQAIPTGDRIVDPTGFLELLNFNYMLGARTIVQGVHRMLWRSELTSEGILERSPPIPHGKRVIDPTSAAKKLKGLLEEELVKVCRLHPRILILLTGGLDSRVIAGVLKKVESEIESEIICATWGASDSRDVEYASRIATWYNWKFIPLGYDHSFDNIERGAIWGGGEVAGVHLHSMHQLSQHVDKRDLVLAASYGDSIGRGEYSGVHFRNLKKPIIKNVADLVHHKLVDVATQEAYLDMATAWELQEDNPPPIVSYELSQQENYMRRMIGHAMNYIRQFSNVYQTFTDEKVVAFMWSLSPESRTDEIYQKLLENLDKKLFDLPWARDGIAPSGLREQNLNFKKAYHNWPAQLKTSLKEDLKALYFSDRLKELGILNQSAMQRYWEMWEKDQSDRLKFGQNIVKVCSLEIARRHFNLLPVRNPTPLQDGIHDVIRRGKNKLVRIMKNMPSDSGKQ